MVNFLVACASTSASTGGGCYDWPVIKQIIILIGYAVEYIYKFLELIGLPNLGLTIILLTLVIKCILLPLTVKQQRFTKLSSYAQPEIKEIQNKYQGKRDNYSMQAMQEETKAVYNKYGISQTAGCIQSFIQFPIIIALYGVIRNIPVYVDSFSQYYQNIVNAIGSTDISGVATGLSGWTADLAMNDKISLLCSLPTKSWNAMMELFSGGTLTTIQDNYGEITKLNTFLGINLGETPWNLILGGGIGIVAVLIPILSGLSQWLSVKLSQAATSTNNPAQMDQTAATMRSMNIMMPLISVFFCFTLNASIGLYWCVSSLFQVALQILINRHYRKIDMDEFIKENMAKAEKKAEKKKNKKKEVSSSTLTQAANTSTRNMPTTIKDRANVNVDGSAAESKVTTPPPANSLAAKAGLVQRYNEEHGDTDDLTDSGHKKYKKK